MEISPSSRYYTEGELTGMSCATPDGHRSRRALPWQPGRSPCLHGPHTPPGNRGPLPRGNSSPFVANGPAPGRPRLRRDLPCRNPPRRLASRPRKWSRVVRAGDPADPEARAALEGLCRDYWYPLYAFARRRGLAPDDACDLVQGFFADLIERGDLAAVDPERGRFRSFLLAVLRPLPGPPPRARSGRSSAAAAEGRRRSICSTPRGATAASPHTS